MGRSALRNNILSHVALHRNMDDRIRVWTWYSNSHCVFHSLNVVIVIFVINKTRENVWYPIVCTVQCVPCHGSGFCVCVRLQLEEMQNALSSFRPRFVIILANVVAYFFFGSLLMHHIDYRPHTVRTLVLDQSSTKKSLVEPNSFCVSTVTKRWRQSKMIRRGSFFGSYAFWYRYTEIHCCCCGSILCFPFPSFILGYNAETSCFQVRPNESVRTLVQMFNAPLHRHAPHKRY